MRIGRIIIIPSIVALGVAGWIATSAETSAVTAHTPAVHVHATALAASPLTHYHN